jgi:predicted amidohydrolase
LKTTKSRTKKSASLCSDSSRPAARPIPAENLPAPLAALPNAARQGAQIICTQELFRSQYFCQSENHDYFKLAEPIPGPSTEALAKAGAAAQGRDHRLAV